MVELVFKPWVAPIGITKMVPEALEAFIRDHGLSDLITEKDRSPKIGDVVSPIGRILSDVLDTDPHVSGVHDMDLMSEFAGRFCYRSWGKGRGHEDYINNVISERHGNVLAHSHVSLIITGVSRSLTHELIRHHVGTNPSQESQRYVTAEGGELEVVGFMAHRAVVPPMILDHARRQSDGGEAVLGSFRDDYSTAMASYGYWLGQLKAGLPESWPKTIRKKRAQEAARCFLPNAAETRLVFTMNNRAARNIIEQRGDVHADLEIRRLAVEITKVLKSISPVTFEDADIYTADDGFEAVRVEHTKV